MNKIILTTTAVAFAAALASSAAFSQSTPADTQNMEQGSTASTADDPTTAIQDKKSDAKGANATTADLNKQQAGSSVSPVAGDEAASDASVPPVTSALPGDQTSSSASASADGTLSDDASAVSSDSASTSPEPKPAE